MGPRRPPGSRLRVRRRIPIAMHPGAAASLRGDGVIAAIAGVIRDAMAGDDHGPQPAAG